MPTPTRAFSIACLTAACAVTFALLVGVGSMAATEVAPVWVSQAATPAAAAVCTHASS